LTWKSKGMGVLTIGIPKALGGSREERKECEYIIKLMTLPMTPESKIQDKCRSVTHVFAFIHSKTDKIWVLHLASEGLKVMNFLSN